MSYVYIFFTVLSVVYCQLTIKWQVGQMGDFPAGAHERVQFFVNLLLNPWIVSAFFAAFLGALSWMVAMTRFRLSHAYPFVGMTFVLVLLLSRLVFDEPLTWQKVVGVALIVGGVILSSQG